MLSKEYLLRFLIIIASALCIILSLSYHFFPRDTSSHWQFSLSDTDDANNEEQSFFERLLDTGRYDSYDLEFWGIGKKGDTLNHVKTKRVFRYGNVPGLALDKSQLMLRETVLAQLILMDRYQLSEKDAWHNIKSVRTDNAFRQYEESRFINELLWFKYQDNKTSESIIKALQKSSGKITHKEFTFFEDLYSAGVSHLLNGDSKNALAYLTSAFNRWPARGRAFGNVYLGLLITYAVENNHKEFLQMIPGIKSYYPDWLYVETYMGDTNSLSKIYPDAALLHVLKGRLVQDVEDYASAAKAYQDAINIGNLHPSVLKRINQWQQDIEKENDQ